MGQSSEEQVFNECGYGEDRKDEKHEAEQAHAPLMLPIDPLPS